MKRVTTPHPTGIIPARFASTRFPGKPLAMIGNKTMIQMVCEQASKALDQVYVATDDKRIADAVKNFGGQVVMTSSEHRSGTDRCAEAAEIIGKTTGTEPEIIINIQGDEPFILPEQINLIASCFTDHSVQIATLISEIKDTGDLFNINETKVAVSLSGDALYFSRAAIPYIRGEEEDNWLKRHKFYKHLGVYAYTMETLLRITSLEQSPLEIAESLEQNRWLENGFRIRTAVTSWEGMGIDVPADLERAKEFLRNF